jgi:hypothetical protein
VAVVGEHVTVAGQFAPAARVAGHVAATENPVPVVVMATGVIVAVPVFVSVKLCVPAVPTVTFPKLYAGGVHETAAAVAETPVPVSVTVPITWFVESVSVIVVE